MEGENKSSTDTCLGVQNFQVWGKEQRSYKKAWSIVIFTGPSEESRLTGIDMHDEENIIV